MIGPAALVDRIEEQWPSGIKQTVPGPIRSGQTLEIVEKWPQDVETFWSDIETSATEIESPTKYSATDDSSSMPARSYAETTENAAADISERNETSDDRTDKILI